jgi:hypothetical protein
MSNVEVTNLRKLTSESVQSSKLSRQLAALVWQNNLPGLREIIAARFRKIYGSAKGKGTKLDEKEAAHVARSNNVQLSRFMNGCAFVLNESGDVGIVHHSSYTATKSDNPVKAAADTKFHIVFKEPGGTAEKRIVLHVTVALPNGAYTTWSVGKISRLSDEEGFLQFISFYWDDSQNIASETQMNLGIDEE